MKRIISLLICIILTASFFVACGSDTSNEVTDETESIINKDTDPLTSDTLDETEKAPEDTIENTDVPDDSADIALNSFRQAMVETPKIFAAAYIGLTDTADPVDTLEWIKEKAPGLCEDLPFLTAVPEERIIGDRYGELYCIVPADPNATVSVNLIDFEGNEGEVLYRSESGEPILLFCNQGGFTPDTEIHIVDSSNNNIVWYPQINESLYLNEVYDLDGNLAVMDFSPYQETLKGEYDYYLNDADFWRLPDTSDLVNTSWEATDYFMDGTEATYYIDILEDTINITWNDGIDEENHHFTAPWSLKTENGISVMDIDLGNLDGERSYCVLITTQGNLIYFSQDFVNNEIHYTEKLTRILERTYG